MFKVSYSSLLPKRKILEKIKRRKRKKKNCPITKGTCRKTKKSGRKKESQRASNTVPNLWVNGVEHYCTDPEVNISNFFLSWRLLKNFFSSILKINQM